MQDFRGKEINLVISVLYCLFLLAVSYYAPSPGSAPASLLFLCSLLRPRPSPPSASPRALDRRPHLAIHCASRLHMDGRAPGGQTPRRARRAPGDGLRQRRVTRGRPCPLRPCSSYFLSIVFQFLFSFDFNY